MDATYTMKLVYALREITMTIRSMYATLYNLTNNLTMGNMTDLAISENALEDNKSTLEICMPEDSFRLSLLTISDNKTAPTMHLTISTIVTAFRAIIVNKVF